MNICYNLNTDNISFQMKISISIEKLYVHRISQHFEEIEILISVTWSNKQDRLWRQNNVPRNNNLPNAGKIISPRSRGVLWKRISKKWKCTMRKG